MPHRMSLSRKMVTLTNRLTRSFKDKLYGHYPTANFQEIHLRNLVSLSDRIELLRRLPLNGVVAEIGVNEGDFSEKILSIVQPQKLVLIDVWASKRYHGGLFDLVKARFARQIQDQQVEIIRDMSFGAIAICPDQYFDWVYLDTDHTFTTTRRELELLRPKMKPGGIIAGHDYILGNWNAGYRYGVIEAVREFCLQYQWEMIFLTHELNDHPSFAIREIG
jgi:hypothetical protein